MKVYFLTTSVDVTVRLTDEEIPSDAALRDLVGEMIASGVEEHFGTVEELTVSKLQTSPSIDSSSGR